MAVFIDVAVLVRAVGTVGATINANIDNRTTAVQPSRIKVSEQGSGTGKTVLTVIDVAAAANDITTVPITVSAVAAPARIEIEFRKPNPHMASTIDGGGTTFAPATVQDGEMFQDSDPAGTP